jgi:hypothetical protein
MDRLSMRIRVALAVGLIGLGFGVLAMVMAVSHFSGDVRIGATTDPEHSPRDRSPIVRVSPTPTRACVTALTAGDGWWRQLESDAPPRQDFAVKLRPKLDHFGAALPNVPRPVAVRLETVLSEVAIGQHHLRSSTSLTQYLAQTNLAVFKGERALVEASDVTGTACGPSLYDSTAKNVSA